MMNCSRSSKLTLSPRHNRMVDDRNQKIPRPMNAFMIFASANRRKLRDEFPDDSNKDISVRLGAVWKSLQECDKEIYYKKAKEEERDHRMKYPDYVYCPGLARLRKKEKLAEKARLDAIIKAEVDSVLRAVKAGQPVPDDPPYPCYMPYQEVPCAASQSRNCQYPRLVPLSDLTNKHRMSPILATVGLTNSTKGAASHKYPAALPEEKTQSISSQKSGVPFKPTGYTKGCDPEFIEVQIVKNSHIIGCGHTHHHPISTSTIAGVPGPVISIEDNSRVLPSVVVPTMPPACGVHCQCQGKGQGGNPYKFIPIRSNLYGNPYPYRPTYSKIAPKICESISNIHEQVKWNYMVPMNLTSKCKPSCSCTQTKMMTETSYQNSYQSCAYPTASCVSTIQPFDSEIKDYSQTQQTYHVLQNSPNFSVNEPVIKASPVINASPEIMRDKSPQKIDDTILSESESQIESEEPMISQYQYMFQQPNFYPQVGVPDENHLDHFSNAQTLNLMMVDDTAAKYSPKFPTLSPRLDDCVNDK